MNDRECEKQEFDVISEASLREEFDAVKALNHGLYFFQSDTATYTINYWLKPGAAADLLVVSKNCIADDLAEAVLKRSSAVQLADMPCVCALNDAVERFSHVLIVPPDYHSHLKGYDSIHRDDLYLCIPIFRCEFSGNETAEAFRWLSVHYTPILDWHREPHPVITVYFDNPKTGGGSTEAGAYLQWSSLVREVSLLSGVENGFIEVTNWQGHVIEILSPDENGYLLIEAREHGTPLSKAALFDFLKAFTYE